jgi:hypothetical protein
MITIFETKLKILILLKLYWTKAEEMFGDRIVSSCQKKPQHKGERYEQTTDNGTLNYGNGHSLFRHVPISMFEQFLGKGSLTGN